MGEEEEEEGREREICSVDRCGRRAKVARRKSRSGNGGGGLLLLLVVRGGGKDDGAGWAMVILRWVQWWWGRRIRAEMEGGGWVGGRVRWRWEKGEGWEWLMWDFVVRETRRSARRDERGRWAWRRSLMDGGFGEETRLRKSSKGERERVVRDEVVLTGLAV